MVHHMQLTRRRHRHAYSSGAARDRRAISLRQERQAKQLLTLAKVKVLLGLAAATPRRRAREFKMAIDLMMLYFAIVHEPSTPIPRPVTRFLNFANHVADFCGGDFRFRTRGHIAQLFQLLQIPNQLRLDSGHVESGEKAFMVLLKRTAS